MREPRKLLLIFVKNPLLGKVKTRLARSLGDAKALQVYQQLLAYTAAITGGVQADKAVFYSDFIDEADLWPNQVYIKRLQQGQDLGQRMGRAFNWGFEQQYEQVVIIGSDCPQLSTAIIQQAFQALQTAEAVIGPAADGGYYLLGLNKNIPALFRNKVWSSPTVLASTLDDLHRLHISCTQLPLLHDLDRPEDIHLLKSTKTCS